MIELAFYKARGNWQDALIRYATRSEFSHVEMSTVRTGSTFLGYGSSNRDGGVVAARPVSIKPGNWQFVKVPGFNTDMAARFIESHKGEGYDWLAIAFTHLLRFNWHNPDKWTCSEIIAAALGMGEPQELSPGSLYRRLTESYGATLVD